jgi:uncharacterized protein YlbG (UPF0298 family)
VIGWSTDLPWLDMAPKCGVLASKVRINSIVGKSAVEVFGGLPDLFDAYDELQTGLESKRDLNDLLSQIKIALKASKGTNGSYEGMDVKAAKNLRKYCTLEELSKTLALGTLFSTTTAKGNTNKATPTFGTWHKVFEHAVAQYYGKKVIGGAGDMGQDVTHEEISIQCKIGDSHKCSIAKTLRELLGTMVSHSKYKGHLWIYCNLSDAIQKNVNNFINHVQRYQFARHVADIGTEIVHASKSRSSPNRRLMRYLKPSKWKIGWR